MKEKRGEKRKEKKSEEKKFGLFKSVFDYLAGGEKWPLIKLTEATLKAKVHRLSLEHAYRKAISPPIPLKLILSLIKFPVFHNLVVRLIEINRKG